MNRWIATITILGLFSPAFVSAKRTTPPSPPPKPTKGELLLSCPVEGASFVIDEGTGSEVRGTTPISKPIELEPGAHTIRVSRDGYLPFSDVFDIVAGQTTEVDVDLVLYSGRLRAEASPGPVEVIVDGKSWGIAPVSIELSIGEHVVRLIRDGYVEEVRKVNIKTGQTTELSVTMVPLEVAQQAQGGGPIYKKWWFWTILGAVAAGVAIPTAVVLTRGGEEPARFDGDPIILR